MNYRDRYTDLQAAELYDVLNPWSRSDAFFLGWVLGARSAIDIGCGTGRLLHRAREAGHTGELVGIDPDPGMIAVASASRAEGMRRRRLRVNTSKIGQDLEKAPPLVFDMTLPKN